MCARTFCLVPLSRSLLHQWRPSSGSWQVIQKIEHAEHAASAWLNQKPEQRQNTAQPINPMSSNVWAKVRAVRCSEYQAVCFNPRILTGSRVGNIDNLSFCAVNRRWRWPDFVLLGWNFKQMLEFQSGPETDTCEALVGKIWTEFEAALVVSPSAQIWCTRSPTMALGFKSSGCATASSDRPQSLCTGHSVTRWGQYPWAIHSL